jgi:hypothetical protein
MNHQYGLALVYFLIMVAFSACGSSEKTEVFTELTNIVVQGNKTEEENVFGKEFSLNARYAKVFFRKSKIIDAKTMHDKYDYLPCHIYGTLSHKNNSCSWEIRVGGTAIIQCPGMDYIIACDNCYELLKD